MNRNFKLGIGLTLAIGFGLVFGTTGGYSAAVTLVQIVFGNTAVSSSNPLPINCVSGCGGGGGTPANPTATAGPAAINGVATTYMRSDAAPAVQLGTAAQKGLVQVDGTSITASSGVISAVNTGTVTSVATSCGVSGGTITTTGTISATATSAVQTGSNYAIVTGNCGSIVYLNNASPQIPTIAQAGTTGFATGWFVEVCNIGAGTQTITPATSTIGGAATYVLAAGSAAAPKCIGINSDGTNYKLDLTGPNAVPPAGLYTVNGALKGNGSGTVSQAACTDLSDDGVLCSATPGTGVATAIAANLSAAGGLTSTIAAGTSALGTSPIGSAACATVVTTAATNTATTDVVLAGFNSDPTAVTGYAPLTTGMLTIISYPTSGNVNFKVCNNTGSSITPGAITLNWRVVR